MNSSEKTVARRMMESMLGGGYLLADSQYDANYLYDDAEKAGFQLVTKKTPSRGRGGLGHRRNSPSRLRSIELLTTQFGAELYRERSNIVNSESWRAPEEFSDHCPPGCAIFIESATGSKPN